MFIFVAETLRKSKTETSLILNKLSQLKEKTSSKLSDLLKKSPVKLFKDGTDLTPSSTHYAERVEVYGAQSAVGRRLSNSDAIISDKSLAYHGSQKDDTMTQSCTARIPSTDSALTLIPDMNDQPEDLTKKTNTEVDSCACESTSSPITFRDSKMATNVNRDSTISLTSTNGGTLERDNNRQCYSSDNLADVEENDYENVGYGDNDGIQTMNGNVEPIYDTITNIKTAEKPDEVFDECSDIPPELPPLPNFLLQRRLVKTKSSSDAVAPSNEKLPSEIRDSKNRMSVPGNMRLNKPASGFWLAYEKYINDGEIGRPTSAVAHHPITNEESNNDATETETQSRCVTKYYLCTIISLISLM